LKSYVRTHGGARVTCYSQHMAISVLIDTNALADWLTQQAPDRWWTVDGEEQLTRVLTLPCSGRDLAATLRRHGGRLNVVLPTGRKPPAKPAEHLDELAEVDEGSRVFQLSWAGHEAEPWLLAEDPVAAAAG
jgi:hypothetical protein